MEYRYMIVQIGCLGVRDLEGREIPSAILSGTPEAIRALGPVLCDPKGVRILLDLEEEAKSEDVWDMEKAQQMAEWKPSEPPPPPKPDLKPVWEQVFPGLECGERENGTLWHQLSSGADDHEAMLTMRQDGDFWRVAIRCLQRETGKVMGPADVVGAVGTEVRIDDLRHLVTRKWHEYVARYSAGTEYSNELCSDGRWRPRVRTEDLWTVRYVERAIRGME